MLNAAGQETSLRKAYPIRRESPSTAGCPQFVLWPPNQNCRCDNKITTRPNQGSSRINPGGKRRAPFRSSMKAQV